MTLSLSEVVQTQWQHSEGRPRCCCSYETSSGKRRPKFPFAANLKSPPNIQTAKPLSFATYSSWTQGLKLFGMLQTSVLIWNRIRKYYIGNREYLFWGHFFGEREPSLHAYVIGQLEKNLPIMVKVSGALKTTTHVQIHLLVNYLHNKVKTILKYWVENVNRKNRKESFHTSFLMDCWKMERIERQQR